MDKLPAPVRLELSAEHEMTSADSFGAWIAPYWQAMAQLARRLSPTSSWEDCLQDALAAAWRHRERFDARRGTPRAWLLAITADQCRKSHRKEASRPRISVVDDLPVVAVAARDLDIDRAIGQLSHRQRLAVELHYFLGLPVEEVASVMGCSAGTVKSTLSDGRARIRTALGEDFYDPQ